MPLLRVTSALLSLALVAGSAIAFSVPSAAAEPVAVPLAGAGMPAVIGEAGVIGLVATAEGAPIDPAGTVFTATAGEAVATEVVIEGSGLAAGVSVGEVVLTRSTPMAGDDRVATVIAVGADGTQTPWEPGEQIAANGIEQLMWTFGEPGTHRVPISAEVTVVAGDPAESAAVDGTSPVGTEVVTLEIEYTVEVAGADAANDASDGASTDAGENRIGMAQSEAPAERSIVSDGEIRIAPDVTDGTLSQSLLDASGAPLDPSATVFWLPDAEQWSGTGVNDLGALAWDTAVPDHGDVWRTRYYGDGANALSLSVDSSGIEPELVYVSFFNPGGIFTFLAGVQTSSTGHVSLTQDGGWFGSSYAGAPASPGIETGQFNDSVAEFSAVFTDPGVYCVTFGTTLQLLADGTVLNDDLTLTFAIGREVDPAAVTPCAQPAPLAPAGVDPAIGSGPIVVDRGLSLLASTIDADGYGLDVVTVDRGRTTRYAAQDVVFSLPHQDSAWPGAGASAASSNYQYWAEVAPPGTRLWRSAGNGAAQPGVERANDLTIAIESAFLNASQLAQNPVYEFAGLTTEAGGAVTTYRAQADGTLGDPSDAAFWDSRPGGKRIPQDMVDVTDGEWVPFYSSQRQTLWNSGVTGFAFDRAGAYCVAVTSSAVLADGTEVSDTATLTFAVGVDPAAVTPCAQEGGNTPTDPTDPGGPGEELDPTVTWFQKGHLDLGLSTGADDRVRLVTGDQHSGNLASLDDAVWVGRGRYATFTVPEPDDQQDLTFIGEPGSTYYGFTEMGDRRNETLWPGLSTMGITPFDYADRQTSWTVRGISGPGEAMAWSSSREYFNSATGLPASFPLGHTHEHLNWAFTEPGVYCISLEAALRKAGEDADQLLDGYLTVAVGDIDLSQVQPCGRQADKPATAEPAPIELDDSVRTVTNENLGHAFVVSLDDGDLDVTGRVVASPGATPQYVDPARVVYSIATHSAQSNFLSDLFLDRVVRDQIRGTVDVELGTVTGPGTYYVYGGLQAGHMLDSRPGREIRAFAGWPGYTSFFNQVFTGNTGVYCVPLRWKATTADGRVVETTKTLTFALGDIDVVGVQLCSEGGEPTDPGEGENPGTTPQWDVPNYTATESGAVIVNNGHVDIASRLSDGRLETLIKDDGSGDTAFRDTGDVVLQLLPLARTTVPKPAAYAFLGAAGDPIWMATQTQQGGKLWPGWSTEAIAESETTAGVQWALTAAHAPGEFSLYQTDAFGNPTVLFNTRDGITAADAFEIPKQTHAHGTWAFSAEGTYCLAFERSTTLASGEEVSDAFTLAVAVGVVDVKKIDPAKCFTAPDGEPSDPDTAPVPLETLTDANTGGVQVLGGANGFQAGQLVTVQIGAARAGQWVSVWLDASHWLGWVQTGSSGAVQVRLPVDVVPASHVLVVKDRNGSLLGWDSLSVVSSGNPGGPDPGPDPGEDPGPAPDPDAVWDVPNGTVNQAGATVLNNGHVDIASVLNGSSLDTLVKDTTASSDPVWRDPAKTVLQLLPGSRATVPQGDQWSFLGKSGSSFYQVTQTAQPGLLWPGWSTESIALDATKTGIGWRLTDVSGPGEFALYETGSFGEPTVLFSTRDGITAADSFTIPKNTHAHGSWAFSAPGNYCLAMQRTTRLASDETASDTFVLAVAVGTADVSRVDPARCGETVDTDPVVVAPPAAGGGAAAAQQVAATQCVAGATILSAGHIDYSSRIVGGNLESLIGDDTSGTKVYREPSGTILWLKPSSRVTLPAGYGAVGPAGSRVWQVPQTQNLDLIWLGWSTESLNAGNTRGPVTWTINSIDGPGSLTVYLSGAFGGVQQVVFPGGGSYQIPPGVHAHANWAFSAEGIYRIRMTQTVTLADGRISSDTETLTIAVGNVDPASAATGGSGCGTVSNAVLLSDDAAATLKAADQATAAAALAARGTLPGQGSDADGVFTDPFTALAQGDPVPLLLSILGLLLLVAAAGAGTLWWRRRRVVA